MTMIRALGLMSGTSMDGIDIALLDTDGAWQVARGPAMMIPYEAGFRRRIEKALTEAATISERNERPGDLTALEREITERHAAAIDVFLERFSIARETIGIVGFHGQTVLHRPTDALTVQIGDGALLARRSGLPVVCDLRANDMVHGGQGAPLAPAYHAALARALPDGLGEMPVVFVNVGGISNVTYVAETGDPVAFDSGPGNALIDQWVQGAAGIPYDDGGRIGSEGGVVRRVVDRYMADPFFDRSGPKSLDRADFTLDEADEMELSDGARTLAVVTAEAIYRAAEHMPERPKLWILCGGGRRNANVVQALAELAGTESARVAVAEEAGFDGDTMEAEAWAYLAARSLAGLPLTWPGTTGCRKPVTGGVLFRPET